MLLAGLANRREFSHAVVSEIARSSRSGRPFVVAMLDVDRLKVINDFCGHRVGDRATGAPVDPAPRSGQHARLGPTACSRIVLQVSREMRR